MLHYTNGYQILINICFHTSHAAIVSSFHFQRFARYARLMIFQGLSFFKVDCFIKVGHLPKRLINSLKWLVVCPKRLIICQKGWSFVKEVGHLSKRFVICKKD